MLKAKHAKGLCETTYQVRFPQTEELINMPGEHDEALWAEVDAYSCNQMIDLFMKVNFVSHRCKCQEFFLDIFVGTMIS